jgi:hypothetical protein
MTYIKVLKSKGGPIAKPPAFKNDKNSMSAKIHSLPLRQTTLCSNYGCPAFIGASVLKLTAMSMWKGRSK